MKRFILALYFLPSILVAQELLPLRTFRQQKEIEYIKDFKSFLAIPNIASDMPNIMRNAEWVASYMRKSGIVNVQLLSPITPEKPPAVFGEVITPGATETIIFYAHYDGQPVDSSKWSNGLHPFKPQLANGSLINGGKLINWDLINGNINPEWRIYARGASDDKAGVFTIINAYAALRALQKKPKVNIKFFFEGEEEAGSTHLAEIFKKYSALL